MRFIIVHGAYGNPGENWFPWLKKELESRGSEAITPGFPTPQGQNIDTWLSVISEYEPIDEGTVLVGHSIGAAFILSLLERRKVRAAALVAGFCTPLGNSFDSLNRTFYKDFDFTKIRENCPDFIIINSDDDPYVPVENAQILAASLRSELILLQGAGHINSGSGYTLFPLLLEYLKEYC
jgi:uncharacterized protein